MDNHVHLVIKGEVSDLSCALKKVNIKYAMMINREGNRIGHVFQDRFRSEEIFDEAHLLRVIRYVHNNPVKAGIVREPGAYHWSSFGEYVDGDVVVTSVTSVTSDKERDFVMWFFAGKSSEFIRFHYKQDFSEYLDTSEEIENNRTQVAQAIIEGFCNERGIIGAKEIYRNLEWAEDLVAELLQKTKLSHRHIAKLVGVSASSVHRASLATQTKD